MLECNHMPTQRTNIELFIQWRMQENRGVVRQNNSETRGVRVRDEEKSRQIQEVGTKRSSAARSRCEVVNATGGAVSSSQSTSSTSTPLL